MQHVALDVVGCHMAGWFDDQDESGYFYGFGVPIDYDGNIPKGFEIKEFPASTYLVFFHPPFDYIADNGIVMRKVQELADRFDLNKNDYWWIPNGYEWNDSVCQRYQRHFPEVLGYEVLRPVKKIKS